MIQRETRGNVQILQLAAGRANLLDVAMCRALAAALDDVERSGAGAAVLTGRDGIFSAGVDLFKVADGGADYVAEFLPALGGLFRLLFTTPVPLVAAVNGHAVAGGAITALCADRRIMARGPGRIGVTELRVGVPFPLLALEIVRYVLPQRHFPAAVYTGETYDPETALDMGFVEELCQSDALLDRAVELAEQMAAVPTATFRLTKHALRRPMLELVDRLTPEIDDEVRKIWSAPHTAETVRDHLERTVGKRSR